MINRVNVELKKANQSVILWAVLFVIAVGIGVYMYLFKEFKLDYLGPVILSGIFLIQSVIKRRKLINKE